MQAENKNNNIKTLSFGCRLNALESEKIQNMLCGAVDAAIVVNTCAVTAEAERQSGQAVRKIARENPNAPIFVTGCAATRNPELFTQIPNTRVISNRDKTKLAAYTDAIATQPVQAPQIANFPHTAPHMSKQFVQIQNGCNHRCAYCVTRLLRGAAVSFEYEQILADVRRAVDNGFHEIVLTGVDIASYARDGMLISDLCQRILDDVPKCMRLRLSSMDPASPEIFKIIDIMHRNPRMMGHMHLSMQSGSDAVLAAMGRRHNSETVRKIVQYGPDVTFSWDIICGFPGETDELFAETMELAHQTRPIKIHAFPFSPRPDTPAAKMSNQINRTISKRRVHEINAVADHARADFMRDQLGDVVQVLVEENNIARTPNDISVRLDGCDIAPRTICNVRLNDIRGDMFIATVE